MKRLSRILLISGAVLFALAIVAALQVGMGGVNVVAASNAMQTDPTPVPWMDHTAFPQLAGPFETGQDVTKACLTCHMSAAQQVMATTHWTWQYEDPVSGEMVGKYNVINNYCINPQSNEPRCTSCHVGYGWTDNTFDFNVEENVDCLVCHDRTGTYKKFPTAAGYPPYEDTDFQGTLWPAVDLVDVAQHIGPTTRENCGSCHFYSGGGDAVKHGDLDSTLIEPARTLDVHMGVDGGNFECTDCHVTEMHQIAGSTYTVDPAERMSCSSCHGTTPHGIDALNSHTDRISCQACHIPEYARGRTTKMTWDWSKAGQLDEAGQPYKVKDENGDLTYDTLKGEFTWESNVVPEYIWYNGQVDYQTLGEVIDPEQVVVINQMMGDRGDPNALIYPVKVFLAYQPYDSGNNILVIPALFPGGAGGANAFWKSWDWNLAIQAGMDYAGVNYSGQYGFVKSEMYWLITHQVAPESDALACTECHSDNGRLDFAALGYSGVEVAMLSVFPPAAPSAEEIAEIQAQATEVTPTATKAPVQQATYAAEPTYGPPADTLGAVKLNQRSGLTPLGWILIGLGGVVLVIVVLVLVLRRR